MSRLAERYWASLTDTRPEALDHLIEHGRRRDLPLWRRYVASLLDVEPLAPGGDPGTRQQEGDEEPEPPTSTLYYSLDTDIALGHTAPERRAGRLIAGWALTAVFVVAAVLGFSLHFGAQEQVAPVIEIGGAPRTSPPPEAREEAGGYAWLPPQGWHRDVKTVAEVHYTSPSGDQEVAAKSSLARGDLMKTWKTSEKNARQGEGYQKIRLEEARFEGWPAVLWEYTFTLNGESWHAVLLGFTVEGQTYQINTWYQPTATQPVKTYEKVRASFTLLPASPSTTPPDELSVTTLRPAGEPS
ncbi:hypothetical protein ACIGMX_21260 [Streptomyces aquilus]|uniref:hypothetical protein n=1 Tax=Streptomyces aquilus TaxID=2548456 RepID=UPI0037D64F22